MADKVFESFLQSQYEAAMALAADSDILTLHPINGPPPRLGTVPPAGRSPLAGEGPAFGTVPLPRVSLGGQSPESGTVPCPFGPPPRRYIASFHARGLVQSGDGRILQADRCDVGITFPDDWLRRALAIEVLTYLGPHPCPWHPNFRRNAICVHLTPGMGLVDLCYVVFELWTYNLFYTGDEGLNHAASQWVRRQDPSTFPTDRRPLKRRRLAINVVETPTPRPTPEDCPHPRGAPGPKGGPRP